MEMKKLDNQKGFTLVEIAIVLVIIGLLLGGVLKGQEMITAAKIKNDTDSLVGFQSSAYAYRDRMGYYPGSARSLPANVNVVAANKTQIAAAAAPDITNSNAGLAAVNNGDFFSELADQGFLKDPNVSPNADETGAYGVGFGYGGVNGAAVDANQNYICIEYTAAIDNALEIVRGMDIKLDDGNPATGTFRFVAAAGNAPVAVSGCLEI